MKRLCGLVCLAVIYFTTPIFLHAEEATRRNPPLEEMSPSEFREALKKSHAEIESRLGSATTSANESLGSGSYDASTEKRNYEISAERQIDMLDHKIRVFETATDRTWAGYSKRDAYKLREIQFAARQKLIRIKESSPSAWKIEKQSLDSLLRQASQYN